MKFFILISLLASSQLALAVDTVISCKHTGNPRQVAELVFDSSFYFQRSLINGRTAWRFDSKNDDQSVKAPVHSYVKSNSVLSTLQKAAKVGSFKMAYAWIITARPYPYGHNSLLEKLADIADDGAGHVYVEFLDDRGVILGSSYFGAWSGTYKCL